MTTPFKKYPVPPDFSSDGCTAPDVFRVLFHDYKQACRWHDWARRHLVHYRILTVDQADQLWYAYMKELAQSRAWWYRVSIGKVLPWVSWSVVKLTRARYSKTYPVPSQWMSYLEVE